MKRVAITLVLFGCIATFVSIICGQARSSQPNRSGTTIIRVDSSKESIRCGPIGTGDRETCKPNPLTLVLGVRKGRQVFLNAEREGKIDNLSSLTKRLAKLFRERGKAGAFRVGTKEVETTVWISTQVDGTSSPLTESDLQKIVRAVKAAGANPIKITDERPAFGLADPLLFPPDTRPIPYGDPKSKSTVIPEKHD